ncbi:hypothetical protein DSO57_1024828 [Entomophthora muscae]|uniref:Uncharacterized protein n=1 Tax=Entomophthora muscae TaxID=34485 RepID=A0ACC2TDD0_9FUNG|nr:hypothetical protein DSO57_1024828 [Entomophthora muscae]
MSTYDTLKEGNVRGVVRRATLPHFTRLVQGPGCGFDHYDPSTLQQSYTVCCLNWKQTPHLLNDNLDAPKSQNIEPESNHGQTPLQTTRLIVATSPPGPKPLTVLQYSARKPPVQDAKNSPKVPTPDTGSLPGEIDKSPPGNYSKLSQSPEEGTEPKEAPNIQIDKQKDLKSSHPKAASGRLPVPSATMPSETPDANPPESRKPDQEVKPGSEG